MPPHVPATAAPAPTTFGAMLRLLRRRARLTQAELGIAVGYSDAQICRLETGRRPPDLTALAALFLPALGVDAHSDDARRLLALAALVRAESLAPPTRPSVRIQPPQPAEPIEDYGELLDSLITLAEQSERELVGGDQAGWVERMEAEHDQLRIALGWAQSKADPRGLRLATALWRFWYMRGYLREGRRWLEVFLALSQEDPAAYARALDAAGVLAWRQSDYAQAEKWYGQSLAITRTLPGQTGLGRVLSRLGLLYSERRSTERARAYFEESLAAYRAENDPVGVAAVLHNLGNLANQQNESDRALAYYEECLALYEQWNDESGIALLELGIGAIARDHRDPRRATASFARSIDLARRLGDDWTIATALINLGILAADRHAYTAARGHLAEAQTIFEQIGDQQSLSTLHARRGIVDLLDNLLGAAISAFRQGLLLANAIDFQPGIADALEGLAACAGTRRPSLAARLFAAALVLREETGFPIAEGDRPLYEAQLERARRAAGPEQWQRDWAIGRALSPAEATALALANVTERER